MSSPKVEVTRVLPASDLSLSSDEASAILEVAYLSTAANGELSDQELVAFREVAPRILGASARVEGSPYHSAGAGPSGNEPLAEAKLRALLDGFDANIEHVTVRERLDMLARVLERQEARELAYKLSFALSICDLETSNEEVDFDDDLLIAFDLAPRADELSAEVYAALEQPDDGPE